MDENGIIQKTIKILDRYSKLYEKLSQGHFKNFGAYMAHGRFHDEDELTKPKLWVDFLEEVLGFPRDEYLPELTGRTGTPDFQPRDQRIHQFFFELKGSDTDNLAIHYSQIEQYLKPPLKWGVLTNMRDLVVYEQGSSIPILDYSFSFLQLYKDYKSHEKEILNFPNTRKFLDFVKRFSFQKLSQQDKVEYLKKSPQWTGLETLDPDELIESIRRVVRFLSDDARSHRSRLSERLFEPKTKEAIALEIETIAGELDRRRTPQPVEAKTLDRYVRAKPNTVEYQASDIYFSRVAYFTMTRILIARMWEDIGFIEQALYNGGFEKWYEIRNRQIGRVLREAFNFAGERYSWLYHIRNNYTWFTPAEETIIEVLYELSKFNLGKLNTDVLGTVYEEYVDRVDRKNKGQYYTPREIIRLIWDRVGFNNDDAFFRHETGRRTPRLIFDPATGSGGFLVEAARRIREEAHYNDKDFDDLIEIRLAITDGLQGGEVNIFAHYITEVNLLIQLTPLIKNTLDVNKHLYEAPPFTLSTIPCDSLGLHLPYYYLTNAAEVKDRKRDLALEILDPQKRDIYYRIKICDDYDYACANPPYIGEKGHKELFRQTLDRFPYWHRFYQGKMDYLYFFVILGLSKLRVGGKLGFITTSFWPTADGANKLRRYILDNALIKEIIDFGETKIFKAAPGQYNMVFILEKCPSYIETNKVSGLPIKDNIVKKEKNRIKIVKVKGIPRTCHSERSEESHLLGATKTKPLKNLIDHIENHIDKKEYSDDYIDVFYSPVKQGELTEGAWNLVVSRGVEAILEKIKQKGEPLVNICNVNQGIVSGADKVTESNKKLLPQDVVEKYNINPGDGIFVLSSEELASLHLTKEEKTLIKPFYKNSDIDRYYIYKEEQEFIIYTTKDTDIEKYPRIKAHLEKFRPILENRLRVYGEDYSWFKLHRERDQKIFEGEKVVTARRAQYNTFALESSARFEQSDITIVTKRDSLSENIKYVLSLINSSVLNFWFEHRSKQKGKVKEYYFTPLSSIPIRRIDFDNPKEVKTHNTLVKKVEMMIETKRKLAEYNKFFKTRLTRLEGPERIPDIDPCAVTKSLQASDLRVVRTHNKVKIEPRDIGQFYLAKTGEVEEASSLFTKSTNEPPYSIRLTGKDKRHVTVTAPKEIAQYLKEVLKEYIGKSVNEIKEIPLAKDLETYESRKNEILKEVKKLLTRVQSLQAEIDDIVYELYGITQAERKIIEKETLSQ